MRLKCISERAKVIRITLKGVADTHSEAMAAYDAAIYTTGVTHVDDQITVLRDKL